MRSRRTIRCLVAAALCLALASPAAARPYGAAGERGEVRYDVPADKVQRRCVTVKEASGRPLCFHWTTSGAHVTQATWVDATVAAFRTAYHAQVATHGYLRPLADAGGAGYGGNKALDVYLADIADDGTFGYCATDRNADADGDDRVPGYCVVDNDFGEFAGGLKTRTRELRGTAAHELFHTVQYAYDHTTPAFLSEGSAVWMEDQVFDGANTNRRYLDITALRQPEDALDRTGSGYGAWLFWQHVAEAHGPAAVRAVWKTVGDRTGTEADVVVAVNKATGQPFGATLATFGAWNYGVDRTWAYEEGRAYLAALDGIRPPLDAAHRLTATRRSTDATGSPGQHRRLSVPGRGIAYIRIAATEAMTIDITVSQPGSAARLKQTAAGGIWQPALFGTQASRAMQLAAGDAAILVLTNPAAGTRTLKYRVEARP